MLAGKSSWNKLRDFWNQPLFNKLNRLSTFCFTLKGTFFYRLVFQRFGRGSCLRKPLFISNPMWIRIGDNVSIREGIRLEVIQDNAQRTPELSIGNNANIEQNVHIVCHSRIYIGDNVSITGNCSIVDVTHPYTDVRHPLKIGARIRDDNSYVEIGDGSFVGYGAVILPNVRIGKYAIIGANSVVVRDVPDYSVAAGVPARIIKQFDPISGAWVSVRGLQRGC